MSDISLIPVHLLTGFLGSGKTTLLARAISYYREHGKKPVVVMNEIGDVNLDGVAVGGGVPMAELLAGCICCSIRGDLGIQLQELVRDEAPDVIFIESTGVAQPLEILDAVTEASLMLPIVLQGVTTVVDGVHMNDLIVSGKPLQRTGRLMRDQVKCASYILLNKVDLLSDEGEVRVQRLLREWNGAAPIVRTVRCDADPGLLFQGTEPPAALNAHSRSGPSRLEKLDGESRGASHEHLSAVTHFFGSRVNSVAFERFLKSLPEGVHRAKGIVSFTDAPSRFLFQFAYREADFTRINPQGAVNDVAVFIGEQIDRQALVAQLLQLEADSAKEKAEEASESK